MAQLEVPIIVTIIGEGGSGGALAIARRRPAADAAVLDLFGDLARGLRLHPLEDRREAQEAAERWASPRIA